jgi:copper chaperone CopZ
MITTLTIDGMLSVHSTRAVYTALGAIDGIASAHVRMGEAVIDHDGRATPDVLRAAVAVVGYTVTEVREDRRRLL